MGFIYKITNDINSKIYVGQTVKTVEQRWKQHKNNYTKEYFNQLTLYKAFNKYGIEHFEISEIEEIDDSKLDEREKYWISYYDSYRKGYNSTLGGREVALYNFDEKQIIQDYHELQTARKVADKYNVDHSTIDRILNKHGVQRYKNRDFQGQKIKAEIHFDSIIECAEYLINHNIPKSTNIQTVKQYISDISNNRREGNYYGWSFSKE